MIRTPEEMEQNLIPNSIKQCGTCEFWAGRLMEIVGECKAPMATSVKAWERNMYPYEGQSCPVYKQIEVKSDQI